MNFSYAKGKACKCKHTAAREQQTRLYLNALLAIPTFYMPNISPLKSFLAVLGVSMLFVSLKNGIKKFKNASLRLHNMHNQ